MDAPGLKQTVFRQDLVSLEESWFKKMTSPSKYMLRGVPEGGCATPLLLTFEGDPAASLPEKNWDHWVQENGSKWCLGVCFQAQKRTTILGIILGKYQHLKGQFEVKRVKIAFFGHFAPPQHYHGNRNLCSNGLFLKDICHGNNLAKLYFCHTNSDEIRAS
ncbi:hypothetical protein ACF0H5_016352 [Mactra antiquata]